LTAYATPPAQRAQPAFCLRWRYFNHDRFPLLLGLACNSAGDTYCLYDNCDHSCLIEINSQGTETRRREFKGGLQGWCQLAMLPDQRLLLGNERGVLRCLTPELFDCWSFDGTAGGLSGSASRFSLIGQTDSGVLGVWTGDRILCLDDSGHAAARLALPLPVGEGRPVLAPDGSVYYLAETPGHEPAGDRCRLLSLAKLDAQGHLAWTEPLGRRAVPPLQTNPDPRWYDTAHPQIALTPAGGILVPGLDCVALYSPQGAMDWKLPLLRASLDHFAVGQHCCYIANKGGLLASTAGGELVWRRHRDFSVRNCHLLGGDKLVVQEARLLPGGYCGPDRITAFSVDGRELASFEPEAPHSRWLRIAGCPDASSVLVDFLPAELRCYELR
jgi:hypothetical protein